MCRRAGVDKFGEDRIDAWVLAELSRRDLVPAIWLPGPAVRADRERARFRLHLVKHRTALKNRIHASLMTFGHPCPVSDLFGVGGRQLLDRLEFPEPWRGDIEASLRLIDELNGFGHAAGDVDPGDLGPPGANARALTTGSLSVGLDTSVVIEWDDPAVATALPDEGAICAVTLAELTAGPHLTSATGERARRQVDDAIEVGLEFGKVEVRPGSAESYELFPGDELATGRHDRAEFGHRNAIARHDEGFPSCHGVDHLGIVVAQLPLRDGLGHDHDVALRATRGYSEAW